MGVAIFLELIGANLPGKRLVSGAHYRYVIPDVQPLKHEPKPPWFVNLCHNRPKLSKKPNETSSHRHFRPDPRPVFYFHQTSRGRGTRTYGYRITRLGSRSS